MQIVILGIGFYLVSLTSCRSKQSFPVPLNDTSAVLNLALKTAFDSSHLPSVSNLTSKYYFQDSILFTADLLDLKYLPSNLGTSRFKILTKNKICSLIEDDSSFDVPNYLTIKHFEKNGSMYQVFIGSISCQPFGGGGGIGIYISKQNDSFIVVDKSSYSIN